ncbi:MAG: tRNA (adenosine(37)-N6)-threonylcarbamoyltransferase complex dimerization subunit type 1 TsaB [Flavobacteriales bacterium]|nr:tRNA (adenosine(37)-N6)-threonylcarbamoyltransferase complex dimerization subunit type 1 TsaB [Bacteroidales bacterium AH-315-I05]PCJ82427.1 MAG: tRNA (adenosine(37)-N6)-threonylcarbamoyltransferase complex dimerization subunit type 1 TsaB [Flavobacteriales bacterium]
MALILNLETSSTVCSIALGRGGELVAFKEVNDGYTHSENLTVFIEEVLKNAGVSPINLDAIAVSKGPGSYTGLRIGVSTAKGLCFALNKPLIGVSTLQAMANIKLETPSSKLQTLFCPMLDARRMEVYTALFDKTLNEIQPVSAKVIDENAFAEYLENHQIIFFGTGAEKCKQFLQHHPNAVFVDDIFPSSKNMTSLSEKAYREEGFEGLAYFEPLYLKKFIATTPKKIL